ncbi:hypothetical protein FEK30_02555 [Picosynechococcus sp. PCC 11901]|uniref:hypothetical protein n=1 Tax=Picosynechococcus sp. PCC 11901 TaxID=2579791 RepID=UPI0010FC1A3A|nr:hypothetical protein [Picosynechococcus sp. PCC 11901]QCS48408.1 hypothetical protein FEK30_02555 [Picosynechococcus sp. PCC 11901]
MKCYLFNGLATLCLLIVHNSVAAQSNANRFVPLIQPLGKCREALSSDQPPTVQLRLCNAALEAHKENVEQVNSPLEKNLFWGNLAIIHASLQSIFEEIDGTATMDRACTQAELSWLAHKNVQDEDWGREDLLAASQNVRGRIQENVQECRNNVGTPEWGAAL